MRDIDYFVDILVRSSKRYIRALKFVEFLVIQNLRVSFVHRPKAAMELFVKGLSSGQSVSESLSQINL